jgi:hypothetical protein
MEQHRIMIIVAGWSRGARPYDASGIVELLTHGPEPYNLTNSTQLNPMICMMLKTNFRGIYTIRLESHFKHKMSYQTIQLPQ